MLAVVVFVSRRGYKPRTVNFPSFSASAAHSADTPPFAEHAIAGPVLRAIREIGFTHCTPIQAGVFPHSLAGRDVAGQAQTGTGKTAAFLVTVFTRLLAQPAAPGQRGPRALVVAPTRELALQIAEDARRLGKYTGLRYTAVVGGLGYEQQRKNLSRGCDVVIGTPGRLIDFVRQGQLRLQSVEVVVLDEADRMFDMGFVADLRFLLDRMPPRGKRQCLLFSATLTAEVERLAERYLEDPLWCRVQPQTPVAEGIEQRLFHVGGHEKLPLLLGLLSRERPERAICFVNTKRGAEWLAERLREHGHHAQPLTGDLRQPLRLRRIREFAGGALPILVATDVAARGLHVERVSHVFNFDLPLDAENYIHRIGRTGRAGALGKAFSFACEESVEALGPIEALLKSKLPVAEVQEDLLVATAETRAPRPRRPAAPFRGRRPLRGRFRASHRAV